ncbi:MAG TPA: sigma-70 factor domain-containing protein, partial [Ktedonosporobacter sp.]|nr:sigma-70 factor domain-containing protein [Ktedonosporobacter sp.]
MNRLHIDIAREPMPDTVDAYLGAIGVIPLLTADEERQLARRIAEGDQEAKRSLILANLRLV